MISDDLDKYLVPASASPEKTSGGICTNDPWMRRKEVCSSENLMDIMKFLNQEFTLLGLPSLLVPDTHEVNTVGLVNCCYELLQRNRGLVKLRSDLEDKQKRFECDLDFISQTLARSKQDLEQTRKDLTLSQDRERVLQLKVQQVQNDLKTERDESKKIRADISHKTKQFLHESRKLEKENVRLREQLTKVLGERGSEKSFGMEIINTLSRLDGRRATWKTGHKQGEVFKTTIQHLEDRLTVLSAENTSLRILLKDLLAGMHKACQQILDEQEQGVATVESVRDEQFGLPYDLLEPVLSACVKSYLSVLDAAAFPDPNFKKTNDLSEQDAAAYKELILEQNELLENLQSQIESTMGNPYLNDSVVIAEKKRVSLDRRLLAEQIRSVEREREILLLSCQKLSSERQRLEAEKRDFALKVLACSEPAGGSDLASSRSDPISVLSTVGAAQSVPSPLPTVTSDTMIDASDLMDAFSSLMVDTGS